MRISYLALTALSLSLTAALPASASCGSQPTCSSSTSGYSYGASSYGYNTTSYRAPAANCPSGTRPSSDGTCLITGSGSSYTSSYTSSTSRYAPSTTRSTSFGNYAGHSSLSTHQGVVSGMSDSTADRRYGSGSISTSYTDGSNTIVPFSTSVTNISSHRIAGMGSNEFLSPTQCPVSVYNPTGGKVMGCYSVSKPAPAPVRIMPTYRTVRVVRPVIYVRYPVPVAVPFPVYQRSGVMQGGCYSNNTRYGESWPGRPCGW